MKSCIDFLNISTILERRKGKGWRMGGRREREKERKKVRKKRGRVEKE